jgi:hypothetical protein
MVSAGTFSALPQKLYAGVLKLYAGVLKYFLYFDFEALL